MIKKATFIEIAELASFFIVSLCVSNSRFFSPLGGVAAHRAAHFKLLCSLKLRLVHWRPLICAHLA